MNDNLHVRDLTVDAGEFEFRAADDGDGLTISGYIARFNEPTLIEDWLGTYTEEIKRSAFARTLNERGASKIKMQVNHGSDSLFGALPIGVWTELREDRKGLFGVGRLHDNWHTVPIRAAIESGAIDGQSFKFRVISDQWRKGDPKKNEIDHRLVTEIALFEAGPVVHPAYEGTSVGLRSRALDMWRQELAPAKTSKAPGFHMTVNGYADLGKLTQAIREYEGNRATSGSKDVVINTVTTTRRPVPAGPHWPSRTDTLHVEEAVAPVGDTDPVRAEADPPVGITRREMRQQALSALGVIHDSDRGAA